MEFNTLALWTRIKKIFIKNKINNTMGYTAPVDVNLGYNFSLSENLRSLTPTEFISFGIVCRAIQIIANDIAKINFWHFNYNSQTKNYDALNGSGLSLLFNQTPNQDDTPWEFKKILIWNLLLYGKCPILKVYYQQKLVELVVLNPNHLQTKINQQQQQVYHFYNFNLDKTYEVNYDAIFWIRYEKVLGFEDVNARNLFKSTFAKLKENELNLINAIKNDLSTSKIIKIPNVADANARVMANTALSEMIRDQKQHGFGGLVVDEKWDLINGNDLKNSGIDFTTRNAIGKEIASMFGIPPQKLGLDDPNKYNSSVEMNKHYIDNAIKPLLFNICQRLTAELIKNPFEKISFKVLDLLSLDIKTIQEFASSGINNGYLTPNEARVFVGLEPLKGGDTLLINSTLIPLSAQINKIEAEIANLKRQNVTQPVLAKPPDIQGQLRKPN